MQFQDKDLRIPGERLSIRRQGTLISKVSI